MRKEHRALPPALSRPVAVLVSGLVLAASACAGDSARSAEPAAGKMRETAQAVDDSVVSSLLAGTSWHLVEFQSMDDATGVIAPDDPRLYTMYLGGDGRVNMRLNCNRAHGEWFTERSSNVTSGRFWFGSCGASGSYSKRASSF